MRNLVAIVLVCVAAGPATLPTANRSRPTIEDRFGKVPAEAWPKANGWDEFSQPRITKWLRDDFQGETFFEAQLTDVEVERKPSEKDPTETKDWVVWLRTKPIASSIGRQRVAVRLGGGGIGITVTEDIAKAARSWRAGDTVSLKMFIQKGELLPAVTVSEKDKNGKETNVTVPQIAVLGSVEVLSVGKWKMP